MMPPMASTSKPRRIVILAFPGVQPLDVIGPAEVFAGADQLNGGGAYRVDLYRHGGLKAGGGQSTVDATGSGE